MENILYFLKWIHIITGMVAFFSAPGAMAAKKGYERHRLFGKIFYYSMISTTILALIISAYKYFHLDEKNMLFLMLIAVFSFYLVVSGYRILHFKRPDMGQKPEIIDWSLLVIVFIISLMMVIIGLFHSHLEISPVLLIFGSIGLFLSIRDLITFVTIPKNKNRWLYIHLTKMMSAYISALTAFSVTNTEWIGLPTAVAWLWPTIVIVPLIIVWSNHFHKKLKPNKFEGERSAFEVMRIRIKTHRKMESKKMDS